MEPVIDSKEDCYLPFLTRDLVLGDRQHCPNLPIYKYVNSDSYDVIIMVSLYLFKSSAHQYPDYVAH